MTTWLRLINSVLYLSACSLLATGLALELKLEHGATLFGFDRDDWGEVHFTIALVTAGLVVIHLGMHWAWIKSVCSRLPAAAIAVLAVGALIIAVPMVMPTGTGGKGEGERHRGPPPHVED
jgi:hypothetical protein